MKFIAQGVSYLFHPLLVPLYGLFFIFNSASVFSLIPFSTQVYCYFVTFVAMLLMPLSGMIVFKKMGFISSYDLSVKQERVYPALVAIFSAFAGFYLIGKLPYTNILSGFSIITLRWKMSMHMTAAGAVCGFITIIGFRYWGEVRESLMVILILSGILATCRLYLKKHNPAQIYAGFLFGLSFVVAILY